MSHAALLPSLWTTLYFYIINKTEIPISEQQMARYPETRSYSLPTTGTNYQRNESNFMVLHGVLQKKEIHPLRKCLCRRHTVEYEPG